MENFNYTAFLDIWHQVMWVSFFVSLAIALFIFIGYKIRYAAAKELKEKFDIASQSEIKSYLRVQYAIAVAIFFVANTAYPETVAISPIWIFIRLFIAFCIATLHGYVSYLIFKYYYPGPLDKRLQKLRYTPRINPSTGNKMKLLSEEEEDVYLDEGMQAEEEVFSVDYDVWIDPETKETKIEKYKGHLAALECDRCGFQTLRLQKEDVLREATEFRDGELVKEYKCSYCGRVKRKNVKITLNIDPRSVEEQMEAQKLSHDRQIKMIRVEIHGEDGKVRNYDFQNRNQAKHFLDEFDFEKLEN